MGGEAVTKSAPRRALFSAFKPELILPLAQGLHELGWEIWGSRGTSAWLNKPEVDGKPKPVVPAHSTEEITGPDSAAMYGHRVATLHAALYGGLLAPHTPDGIAEAERRGHKLFHLVGVVPYPFADTPDDDPAKNERIDVGGPTMLRAGVKNRRWVIPLHVREQSLDAQMVLTEIRESGDLSSKIRDMLAAKAALALAADNLDVAGWLRGVKPQNGFPSYIAFMQNGVIAKYGENKHQPMIIMEQALPESALINPWPMGLLKGDALSYNNYLDLDYAISGVIDVASMSQEGVTAFAMKHAMSCGAAWAPTLGEAIENAFSTDIVAKYGCTLAISAPAGVSYMEMSKGTMVDVLAGPSFTPELIRDMSEPNGEGKPRRKAAVVRVQLPDAKAKRWEARTATGRLLVQEANQRQLLREELKVVTKAQPTEGQLRSMDFAWRVARHARSNAIVLVRGTQTVGVAAGHTSRVNAVRNAIAIADHTNLKDSEDVDEKLKEEIKKALAAGPRARGSVLGSDAYFPRPDGIVLAGKAGVEAIMQPGGSKYDPEAIAVADQYGMVMVLTGWRVFRH